MYKEFYKVQEKSPCPKKLNNLKFKSRKITIEEEGSRDKMGAEYVYCSCTFLDLASLKEWAKGVVIKAGKEVSFTLSISIYCC